MGSSRGFRAIAAAALVAAGCVSPAPPEPPASIPSVAPTLPPASVALRVTPSPIPPTPVPVPTLLIADLPDVDVRTVHATAVCEPEPSQVDIDAGDVTVSCSDGLAQALAAVATVTGDPVLRLFFDRPSCTSMPCTEDELSSARVTAWTATAAFEVELDSRLATIPAPTVVSDPVWPAPGSAAAPAIARPAIEDAPRVVAARAPYPFCGRAEMGEPPAVLGCFRDAVLAGRRAEMIEQVYGTEGGAILLVYRFDGSGPLVRFQHDQSARGDGNGTNDTWRRDAGAMILGIGSQNWSFDPWWGTELKVAA